MSTSSRASAIAVESRVIELQAKPESQWHTPRLHHYQLPMVYWVPRYCPTVCLRPSVVVFMLEAEDPQAVTRSSNEHIGYLTKAR